MTAQARMHLDRSAAGRDTPRASGLGTGQKSSITVTSIDADVLRVSVGPGALHVDRFGHGGSPIVLLHGFATSSFLFRHVGPSLALLGHTAFAADLFGYGESDRPFDADFGIAAQAEYVDQALTALRIGRPTLVGVGLGGAVALRLTAMRPDRLRRLVLVNSPAFDLLPGRDIRELQRNAARFAIQASRSVLGVAPLLTPILRDLVADPDRMPDRLVARYLAPFVGRDGVSHLIALANAIRAEEMDELELGAVSTPTLVVWGDADPLLAPSVAERISREIPDCQVTHLAAAAQLVPEERPDELTRLVHEFSAVRDAEVA